LFWPAGAALAEAALGDPPVEGMEDPAIGGGALWRAALTEPAVDARAALGSQAALRATRYDVHPLLRPPMLPHL